MTPGEICFKGRPNRHCFDEYVGQEFAFRGLPDGNKLCDKGKYLPTIRNQVDQVIGYFSQWVNSIRVFPSPHRVWKLRNKKLVRVINWQILLRKPVVTANSKERIGEKTGREGNRVTLIQKRNNVVGYGILDCVVPGIAAVCLTPVVQSVRNFVAPISILLFTGDVGAIKRIGL